MNWKSQSRLWLLILMAFGLLACEQKDQSRQASTDTKSMETEQHTSADGDTTDTGIDQVNKSIPVTDTQQTPATMSKNRTALIKTSKGEITIELDAENAPLTVANFIRYIESGHYDGTVFHRVIPGFMIQGGGFASGMQQKPTQAPIQNEANNGLSNTLHTIAMARTNDPHSATSQFFINTVNNERLDFTSESGPGWGYAVFGKVTDGFDVVKQIEIVETGQVGQHGDVPNEDVIIKSVTLVD